MIEWKEFTFRELLVSPVRNGIYKKKEFHGRGCKIVNMGELFAYPRLKDVDMKRVELNDKEKEKALLKKGDLIFARRSLTAEGAGKCSLIQKIEEDTTFESSIIRASPDQGKATSEFLYYYFNSRYGKYLLSTILRQVAVAGITGSDLMELVLKIPPLTEQKAIASVLSSLDDKIDLLRHQNKTLEAMAETLFRQWFVEEAQDDWEDGCLSDIADINPTYSLKKGELSSYLEMKNVSTSTFNPEYWYQREFKSGMKFQNGDTLLARITPCLENGKTCFVTFLDDEEIGWGSTEYIVLQMKQPFHPYISYIIAKYKDFRDFAISSMSGSSGRQRVQANVIKEYDIQIPPSDIIHELNEHLAGLLPKLINNAIQIRTLEKLRDTLLPKLMSGEVLVEYQN